MLASWNINLTLWGAVAPHINLKLEGDVDWEYQRSTAEDEVRYLMGVKGVINEITIKAKAEPISIKGKIEAGFKRNAILDASQINVQADGG